MRASLKRILFLCMLPLAACDLDIENPNALTEEEVLADQAGIISLAVGMQGLYAGNFEELIQASALVTDEWGTTTGSLLSYRTLLQGPTVDIVSDFGVVEEPFETAFLVVRSANTILENVGGVQFDAATAGSIRALAKLFKAMALGAAIQHFEEIPIDVSVPDPVFQSRDIVLDTVIALLESARTELAAAGPSAIFDTRVVPEEFDVGNTIDAMLARYHLIDGNYSAAITAADRVDLTSLSLFIYPTPDINPIFNLGIYVSPLASFVAEAEPGDERPAFWVDVSATPTGGTPPDTLLLPFGQYGTPDDPIPVFLPDEMKLIQAEAYTRLGDFDIARGLVNEVRTQSSSTVEEPVANLPAIPEAALDSEAELLAQIAYERRYELYEQGLRWEDVRRFGEALTTVPTIEFLPIPRQECVTNETLDC
ncbi:MAG TPA: RagB/SusD family nutrient uptake outer membrane protein [Longimicrobiales bacterium]|nr:RagB/SusD family nutrient uptake outer membrane protein [Longimicrobiales bacterium]